jgi:hypothetical protein
VPIWGLCGTCGKKIRDMGEKNYLSPSFFFRSTENERTAFLRKEE